MNFAVLRIFEVFLAALYLGATVMYSVNFIRPGSALAKSSRIIVRGIPIVHIFYIIILGFESGRFPVASIYEFLSILSLGLVVIYIYLESKFGTMSMGPLVLGIAAIFQTISTLFATHPVIEPGELPLFRSPWLALHMVLGSLAYASLLISAVFSTMYLILYKSIKRKSFGVFFERFLPLSVLAEMNRQAMTIGVILLGIMVPIGIGMVFMHYGKWIWDFKYLAAFLLFIVYLSGAILARSDMWRGSRLAYYSITTMILLILTMGVSLFGSASHRWK